MDEIFVSGTLREELLSETELSVTALDGNTVEAASLENIIDMAYFSPGLVITSYNPTSPQVYIRGVGTNASSVGDESSVSLYQDGVFSGRAGAFSTDFFDIERIEVLKGPQGTFHGRNSVGGVIQILTKDPTMEKTASVLAGYGEHNLWELKGHLNAPLSNKVAARMAFSYRNADGYTPNLQTGNILKDKDNLGTRLKVAVDLSDDTRLLISADYARDDLLGPAARTVAGFEDFFGFPPVVEADEHNVSLFTDGYSRRDIWGTNITLSKDLPSALFTSQSAYRGYDFSFADDLLGTHIADTLGLGLVNEVEENSWHVSQKFQLQSETDTRLDWLVGAYYFHEQTERTEIFDSSRVYDLSGFPGLLSRPVWDARNKTDSISVYGDVSYRLKPRLKLSLGARYTWDKKSFSVDATAPDLLGFLAEEYQVSGNKSWSNFSPRIALSYHFTKELMLYGSIAQGYKAGGFNGIAPNADQASIPFNPETATNYEIGLKWRHPEGILHFNAAAFYLDYKDLQTFFGSGSGFLTVTSNARSYGIEVDGAWSPAENMEISFSYGWLDGRFKTFAPQPDFANNRLPRAPVHSVQLSLLYSVEIGSDWTAGFRLDGTYQSSYFFSTANNPFSGDDGHVLLNGRIDLSNTQDWTISLWGKNLTNAIYPLHAFNFASLGQVSFPVLAEDRTFGIQVSKSF
ncbi:TonB-dependent receptor [Emcibacter sp.]|uniref:TonB-dependent receptor n=1 Tax=Emcibacter sp. TaxID=1979954 RepID=UPI003A92E261